jgi:hypothetical protein
MIQKPIAGVWGSSRVDVFVSLVLRSFEDAGFQTAGLPTTSLIYNELVEGYF